jgi:hypothetical protein
MLFVNAVCETFHELFHVNEYTSDTIGQNLTRNVSPGSSKPATHGHFKTGQSEIGLSYQVS